MTERAVLGPNLFNFAAEGGGVLVLRKAWLRGMAKAIQAVTTQRRSKRPLPNVDIGQSLNHLIHNLRRRFI